VEEAMTVRAKTERTECVATPENPFHFVDSGLSNVYLVGIRYFVHPDGKIVPEIPAVKQLMQLIARDLIEREYALTGHEIRFLRKRLGQKGVDFARAIGIEPETLSRAENDHQKLNESNDKLIRLYYVLASDDANLAELYKQLRSMMEEWHQTQYTDRKPVVAAVTNDEWQLQAA
jgi:transcriptional regulator with XRE-family HTH domain